MKHTEKNKVQMIRAGNFISFQIDIIRNSLDFNVYSNLFYKDKNRPDFLKFSSPLAVNISAPIYQSYRQNG